MRTHITFIFLSFFFFGWLVCECATFVVFFFLLLSEAFDLCVSSSSHISFDSMHNNWLGWKEWWWRQIGKTVTFRALAANRLRNTHNFMRPGDWACLMFICYTRMPRLNHGQRWLLSFFRLVLWAFKWWILPFKTENTMMIHCRTLFICICVFYILTMVKPSNFTTFSTFFVWNIFIQDQKKISHWNTWALASFLFFSLTLSLSLILCVFVYDM